MTQELEVASCGLDYSNARLHLNYSKNFGPERIKTNSADFVCEYINCPLTEGVEIKFSTITDDNQDSLESTFSEILKDPNSTLSQQLRQARLKNCPFYKKQFGDTQIK